MPHISQKLKLTCGLCGDKASYDVGRILCERADEGDVAKASYAFGNYFRCRRCGGAGPWEVADYLKLIGMTVRAAFDHESKGLAFGRPRFVRRHLVQTPAMGEEHLLSLIRKDPGNAFLCSRLGNLLRNCDQHTQADHWHAKALGLDPDDIESRHHLFSSAMKAGNTHTALAHALRLARSLLEGYKIENNRLNEDIALSLAEDLRRSAERFRACLPAAAQPSSQLKEEVFIRTLLARLEMSRKSWKMPVSGCSLGNPHPKLAEANDNLLPSAMNLFPTLRALVESEGLNAERLTAAAFESNDREDPPAGQAFRPPV